MNIVNYFETNFVFIMRIINVVVFLLFIYHACLKKKQLKDKECGVLVVLLFLCILTSFSHFI